MSTEHGPALPEALNPALISVLSEQTRLLTPLATELYQSALTAFGSETQAQKQLIFTLTKELSSRPYQETCHLPPAQQVVFTVQLVCELVKHASGVDMIAMPSPERAGLPS